MLRVLALLAAFFSTAFASTNYFGVKSTEAVLSFTAQIEVSRAQDVQAAIDYQLSFLIGHFQSQSFTKAFRYPGVLGDQKTIKILGREKNLVTYSFIGKVNFQSQSFNSGREITVPLKLPLNPFTIYQKTVVGGKSLCTDEHYNSEGDFFYFWDSSLPGCPLKKKNTDVLELHGVMKKLDNTTSTYPEFDRLYKRPELSVSVVIGFINGVNPKRLSKKDEGYGAFSELSQKLLESGFSLSSSARQGINHLQTFEKSVSNALGFSQLIKLRLILADSETDTAGTFTQEFKRALETSDVVAYDGHSGLGGYLDLARFGRVKLPSFYQIFFFNGCSSYPYYNSMYFNTKPGGSRNLEILTAGLPTLTSTSVPNMMAFLSPFISGRITSYQTLLKNLEKSNGEETTYLMGVNGDADNRFRP